ncbi:MAG: metallophosphoesterase [Beijerinckiaceae bacterium]
MPIYDPRRGDIEDDQSAPQQASLMRLAGSLLTEISLPKLLVSLAMTLAWPLLLVGIAPLLVSAWWRTVSNAAATLTGIALGAAAIILTLIALYGWRPLFRSIERNFWALNAVAVQPAYALAREWLRYMLERGDLSETRLARRRAQGAVIAGVLLSVSAVLLALAFWPYARWSGTPLDLLAPARLVLPALANALVMLGVYLALASLIWAIADARTQHNTTRRVFKTLKPDQRHWRIAHLSDVHVVGEPFGFRIESGRGGPQGNGRFERAMRKLDEIHAIRPLDHLLITGDMVDAGQSTEWAEFFEIIERYPALMRIMLILPGNHDVNIVDRKNPARLDLPFSPNKRLRQMRCLAAMARVQGIRVAIAEPRSGVRETLAQVVAPLAQPMAEFFDRGRWRGSARLGRLWHDAFPMIVPPAMRDGLGVIVLNSNAETHFSFTNALGLISAPQLSRALAMMDAHPEAGFIFAVHHHLAEYPMRTAAFAERIGTALINGNWVLRELKPYAHRIIVMHGHRHIDWIGQSGALTIVSAPSPVMNAKREAATGFYIHTVSVGDNGAVSLGPPQRIAVEGDAADDTQSL